MTPAQKGIREYLAEIGKRGGLASRRELTKSHERQMVAIREMKRAAVKGGKAVAADQFARFADSSNFNEHDSCIISRL